MKRFKHSLSNYKLLSASMGFLYPVQLQEVLPGDSFRGSTSALIRVSPLVAPVMHPVTVRIHHWFVPHRLVWPKDGQDIGWENFITGGHDGADAQTVPTIAASRSEGDLLDYLGVPPVDDVPVSDLPLKCFNLIYNEWYRDQDLISERDAVDLTVPHIAWEKDYLTSSRPWPQKGPDVTVPLGESAPVRGIGREAGNAWTQNDTTVFESDGTSRVYDESALTSNTWQHIERNPEGGDFPNIYADLTEATAANVNEWRRAFALQRYQEARARYGSRYSEYLRYLGVTPADSRLQRPEYLGGGKSTINFSEVLQTVDDETGAERGPLGRMGGHGIAALRTRPFTRYFNEHGYMLSLMSVRPKTIYQDGIPRTFLRQDKEDFWQLELAQIGQQAVKNNEVYADLANGSETFSYQDRYAEYKRTQSQVSGEFRTLLDYWHMARKFDAPPALNEDFVNCDATKRIHAEQNQDSLWCMVQNNLRARRFVRKGSNSRIL